VLSNRISIRGMSVAAATTAVAALALTVGVNAWAAETAPATHVIRIGQPPSGATVHFGSRTPYGLRLREIKAHQRHERALAQSLRSQRAPERASRSAQRSAPAYGGDPRSIAADMAASTYGWDSSEFSCLDSLWTHESGWSVTAQNSSSGAYGIPQALPGSKMGEYGSDWATNPATQIEWGLAYINDSYGSPCSAWSTYESQGWY
jgi:hypothetical protein